MNSNDSTSKHGSGSPSPGVEHDWRRPRDLPSGRSLPLLPVLLLCLTVGLTYGLIDFKRSKFVLPDFAATRDEPFRLGVNRAMNAAQLTQTAASLEEWQTVAKWWRDAIAFMEEVPRSNPKYDLAQDKVTEYQTNLRYAQMRSQIKPVGESSAERLWGIGARRADVIRVQGQPTQVARYDTLCQEVLSYGNSTVELHNGVAVSYEDVDRNLKAAAKDAIAPPPLSAPYAWTLGSAREDVLRIQGTPVRVNRVEGSPLQLHHADTASRETLYYGNSMVELTAGRVTSYSNRDGNLSVAVAPLGTTDLQPSDSWTIGSERNQVFKVQGTPTEVLLDNSLCREMLRYGDSTVELRNGFVSEYGNYSNNLRVTVK